MKIRNFPVLSKMRAFIEIEAWNVDSHKDYQTNVLLLKKKKIKILEFRNE